jgi:ferritin-like metal-binding protein YciE
MNETAMKTLKDLFSINWRTYGAGVASSGAAQMAKAATCPDLRAAFQSHLKETESQVKRLDQVFESCGMKASRT